MEERLHDLQEGLGTGFRVKLLLGLVSRVSMAGLVGDMGSWSNCRYWINISQG